MRASSAPWALLCLATIASGSTPYSDQPRLESQNGHLLIIGAAGANISLQTSQGGQININDENVLRVLDMARQAAQKVDRWENKGAGRDSDSSRPLDVFLAPLKNRLENVESLIANGSIDAITPKGRFPNRGIYRRVRKLNLTVNLLANDLKNLRNLVEANECASGPCLHGGTCQDLFKNYHCICPDQWEGLRCHTDVDECEEFKNTGLGCQNGATCQNLPGSYSCICPPGWYGLHCTKKTRDCKTSGTAGVCGNGDCYETNTGVLCQCYQGWDNDKITGACTVDIDECAANTNPCSHDPPVQCENLSGKFKCGPCPKGFVGNGYQCQDIDECLSNNGGCSTNPMVQCINTRGYRVCGHCPPGYSGDGLSCSRVDDPCQVNRGGCHPLAQCIQNPGLTYVQCRCPLGWVGSGVGENGCIQDNRTTTDICPLFYCLNGGTCSIGSDRNFNCNCQPGFTGPRCEIGDLVCASQPCKNNGTCIPVPGQLSYKCVCPFGYTGDNCEYSRIGCGGAVEAAEGKLSFPNNTDLGSYQLPLHCRWQIILPNDSLVLNLTVEHNISCTVDSLTLQDGFSMTSQYQTTKFCGFGKANYTTTRATVWVIYEYISSSMSKWIANRRQFTLSWTSVQKVCGGHFDVKSHGQISSPGFPGVYPNLARCKWTLSAPSGKRILLTFSTMDIESHNYTEDVLKIFDGAEISDTPLATFKQRTIPPPISTSSNEATLLFVSDQYGTGIYKTLSFSSQDEESWLYVQYHLDIQVVTVKMSENSPNNSTERGFQIVYSLVEGIPGCGGLLTAPYGRILPPQGHKSDGSFADSLKCEWKIRMPGRDTVKVETSNFKMEWSTGCTYDSLEFYDGPDTESKLIGRWCGQSGPEPLKSSGNSMTIVLNSDSSYNEGSFTIDYSLVCNMEFSSPNGTITSPLYPSHYPEDRLCQYLIALPVGFSISLQILDIDLEPKVPLIVEDDKEKEVCLYDTLTIYDGDSPSSKVLSELCGNGTVSTVMSSHNYMLLVFKSDISGGGRGFKAKYTSTPIGCGGIFRSEIGTIKTPSDIQYMPECKWIISAPVGKVIELGWSSASIPNSMFCSRSNIQIFENNTDTSKAQKLGESYCGGKIPPTMTSTSNILMIVLKTASFATVDPKFTAYYRIRSVDEGCSGHFFSSNGVIQSPMYPEEYPSGLNCVWTITVPTGKQISLHFKNFLLEGTAPCKSDYLEIRNGGYASSPLIGKYCGGTISDDITSFGNQLYIRFYADSAISSKGFSLTWDGTLSGCGGDLVGYSGSIISPNYPNPYSRNGMCTWRISVSLGSLVALSIVDIELEAQSSCGLDYLEIRDGITSRSPMIGRYCTSDHPVSIRSTGNSMYIQFRSDVSREGRGFHLKFSTVCNRTLKGYRGVIESPEFPLAFSQPVDCTWTIEAPIGNAFTIAFSHLMTVSDKLMASFCGGENPTDWLGRRDGTCAHFNKCDSTYIQINEGTSSNGKMLGRYCGSQSPPTVNSTLNEIQVNMKVMNRAEALFRLEWFVVGCGGILKGKGYGDLSTPDFPDLISRPVVCEWTIIVDLGTSIRISVSDFVIDKPNDCDQNALQIYGGPDSTSPLLSKLCLISLNNQLELQTSGNHAFVRLQVTQANKHFKFRASYEQVLSSCGGLFNAQEGSFHSKNYPQNYDNFDDCTYSITIAETHRINLTFVDFDIDAFNASSCSSSYVKVFDGEMDSADNNSSVRTLCGNAIPQPIISLTNKLTIRFNAGGRVAKGFYVKYAPICGTNINVTNDGLLSHTEYYTTISNHNCTWVLRSAVLGKKLTLTFTKLEIRQSAPENAGSMSPSNINNLGLTVYVGEDESMLLMNLTGEVTPPSIEIPGGMATVKLVTTPNLHVSFNLLYSTLDNACGGTLEADSGQFASPNFPSNYPPNVECVWTILNTPGNQLNMQFEELAIQSSESCNENYVEVRAKDESGVLIGAYCGQLMRSLPHMSSVDQNLWVKFKSSTGVDKGFKAMYSIASFSEISRPSGDLQSPGYPSASIRKTDYKWRITTASKSLIDISFNEVYFEGSSTCLDKLTIFDGYDQTAKVLKELCGLKDSTDLEKVLTSSNVVFIVFHSVVYPARFSLSWSQFSRSTKSSSSKGSSVNCTQQLQIPLDSSVDFISPGFPHGYRSNLRCEWILVTEPQNHLEVSFSTIDVERYRGCISDRIEVFDGASDGSWNQVATLCNKNDTEKILSGRSMMKVMFTTDFYGNKTGFSASASSVCGGSLSDPDGVIVLNRTDYLTSSCVWNITVKSGKKIEVTFGSFNFPNQKESTSCAENYLILRDGFEDDAPFVDKGKLCGNTPPKVLVTSSNRLAVVASGEGHFGFKTQQMELRYITKSRTCTSNVHLSPKSLRSMIIRSPNYPNMPPPHSECTWQFFAPSYETIHIEFVDRFDLAYSFDCEKEYLELRDGSTELSPLLGRYCYSTPPSSIMSEGNALFVKYFSNLQYPNNGFKAKVSLSDCGGTYHDFYSESIETPNYPASYEAKVNCVWRFINPSIDNFKFTVEKFRLGMYPISKCNVTTMDTLTITMVDKVNPKNSESWIVCGLNFTAPQEITGNEFLLNFTAADTLWQRRGYRSKKLGFKIDLRAHKTKCGGRLDFPSGEIKSPGYPTALRSTFCTWKITVPQGRRVTLSLTDFNLGISPGLGVYSPVVMIYNDFLFSSELAKLNGSIPSGTSFSSSDNKMLVYYYNIHSNDNRGFRGVYTSELPSLCSADGLDQPSGTIRVNFQPPFLCTWEVISKEMNQTTTTFTVIGTVDQGKIDSNYCFSADSTIEFNLDMNNLLEFCGVADQNQSPFIVVSPFSSTAIMAKSDSRKANANYTISWITRTCGGELSLEGDMTITNPVAGGRYPPNYDCVWKIQYPEETTIKVQFKSLDLDMTGSTTDCSSDYLAIHNGDSSKSPIISKYCGTILPADLLTLSNNLWIHFHSDRSNEAKGFSLMISPAQEACGGILHESKGSIMSVNYPNQYPNQSNCVYEIRVDKGYHIGLQFIERFYIEDSPRCLKDYVEVFNFDESSESWKSLGRVCGRQTPKIFNSTSNKMRVHFKSDDNIQGDGFKASWTTNCGGVFDGSKPGVIHSPHYPRNYDNDLACNYTVTASSPLHLIYGSFDTFELEPRKQQECTYDFVEIWYYYGQVSATLKNNRTPLGKYCGTKKPPRFVSFGSFKFSFVTDRFTGYKGFLFNYGPEECGGNVTQPLVIRNRNYTQRMMAPARNCTWRITAPSDDQVVVIKIQELVLTPFRACGWGSVRIWDGTVIQGNNSNLMATLCGTFNGGRSGLYRTKSPNAIINFYSPGHMVQNKIVAEITFVPACGQRVELSDSETYTIEIMRPSSRGKHILEYVECPWVFSSPSSTKVSANFTKTNGGCPNDYTSVEIYDGIDENSELIGRFNCSTIPDRISSSRSFMMIKYTTNFISESPGFVTILKSIKSLCGITNLRVTDEPQTLTSPYYPGNYPENIHCKWVLSSQYTFMYIRVEEVDIIQSAGCANDSLKIKDLGLFSMYNTLPVSTLLTSDYSKKVYIGNSLPNNDKVNLHMGSKYPHSTSIFCGVRKGVDYYSSSDLVMVKFVSSSSHTSKGFKITYSTASCSRNFTAEQGRIKIKAQHKSCVMHVISPNANSTISLYFSEIRAYYWNRKGDVIKILDGMDASQESKVLRRIKNVGIEVPEPVFSNSSSVTISMSPGSIPVSFDITYTTTTEGHGCGGYIVNYGGIFTSPLYPRNVRNFTTCRWDVVVPVGSAIELEFTTFDLGPKHTCKTDYLQIYDVEPDTDVLRRTYCGGDTPAKYTNDKGQIAVRYVTSIHNGGTGWVARFMARSTDPSWPGLVGQNLIN